MIPPLQLSLFDTEVAELPRVPAAVHSPDIVTLARKLPERLHLGTSSWSFPGWEGLIYGCRADRQILAREGLAAYAQHPLMRTVSLDRTYYGPLTIHDYRRYAEAVPPDFRFLVKAPHSITAAYLRNARGQGSCTNPDYLDPAVAKKAFLAPLQEGLGVRLGVVVLQFPPQGRAVIAQPDRFAERLADLLDALGPGGQCAVELRDPALLTPTLMALLAKTGTGLCVSVHPRMPDLGEQLRQALSLKGLLVVRWNLHAGLSYEEARARYAPFDRLREENLGVRRALSDAAADAICRGRRVYVTVNNKAEGSAPLSVLRLAQKIAEHFR